MRLFYLGILLFALDQGSKAWVRHSFHIGESRPLIDGVLHLTYVQNTGAAFGLLQGQTYLIIAVTLLVALVLFLNRKEFVRDHLGVRIAYTFGIAGGLGNLLDRILHGWVTDFIDLRVWPVFNVADSSIFVGVALLIWFSVIRPSEEGKGA